MLAEAAEMEHNLLCSYLYAAFSLRGRNEGLSAEEEAAVLGWRATILSVAVEEMGHLAMVNNLAVALGGEPRFDRPNFPVPPGHHPSGFDLRLTPFDRATLKHFVFLERPEEAAVAEPGEFGDTRQPPRETGRPMITPSARDYDTIGELYAVIRRDLRLLAAERGARTFFHPERQLSAEESGIAGVTVIRDLASALAALHRVVEQGEGGAPGATDSHFARFTAIEKQWRSLSRRNPAFAPAHPAASDPVMRRPARGRKRVWITAQPAAEMVDLGNAVYGVLLALLAQLYEPHAPRKTIAAAAMDMMRALSRIGSALARLPASPDLPGVNAGLTFAVPRAAGPRAELGLLEERLSELAPHYDGEPNHIAQASAKLKKKPRI
jgi:hypothetical protein